MSRRRTKLAVGMVIATLVVFVGVPSVSAAHRMAVPSCATVISESALLQAMGGSPDLHAVPVSRSKYSLWADGPGDLRGGHIPYTSCFYDWTYTTPGSLPAGDPDPDTTNTEFLAPNVYVDVGAGVSSREWGYIKANEASDPGGAGDDCSGCAYDPQRSVSLGAGTKAFIESFAVPAPASTPPAADATCYMLYVLTKHHNLLDISVWPATLAKQEALVESVLTKFPKF